MLGLLNHLQYSFYEASRWNEDNLYSSLTATALALLNFETPRGLRFHLSSLPSPNFASSYTFGTTGVVDGSISYLYSSLPLLTTSKSANIVLEELVRGYRQLSDLSPTSEARKHKFRVEGQGKEQKDVILYGRMYLPKPTLEALYVRRLSPTQQLKLSCVSDTNLPNGGNILALIQRDVGKYSSECLYSTDSALLGIRGLYNFGHDPRSNNVERHEPVDGRFSAGAEIYYGVLNKSGGMSAGLRFATLPRHLGFPYTMTLTVNPLMGNLSSTYAVKAGRNLTLCSKFDFNFYSYESGIQVGCELWRRRRRSGQRDEIDGTATWAKKMIRDEWREERAEHDDPDKNNDTIGLLKARADQDWNVALLWESRLKHLLCTLGASFDLRKRDQIFRAVGLELQYST